MVLSPLALNLAAVLIFAIFLFTDIRIGVFLENAMFYIFPLILAGSVGLSAYILYKQKTKTAIAALAVNILFSTPLIIIIIYAAWLAMVWA